MSKNKIGIIQSRGLGDIAIALPIARYYADQGHEVVWPICSEFISSWSASAPWVTWVGIETDPAGDFFLKTPLRVLAEQGVAEDDQLYLYQYLNTSPELTDPELYSILKFDQYKYWVSGVPFRNKWSLAQCVTRDLDRERAFAASLALPDRYAVAHFKGSTFSVELNTQFLDPAVQVINIDDHLSDSIWDWITVLEGAEAFIGIDSIFANLVDQLQLAIPDLYWIRRSPWDLTPVLGSAWTMIPTNLSTKEAQRVDPAAEAAKRTRAAPSAGQLQSHVPYTTDPKRVPTSFMSALRPAAGGTTNLMGGGVNTPRASGEKLNAALNLYKQLGVKY
jgi:type II secretory pathway pseudopilin PulG